MSAAPTHKLPTLKKAQVIRYSDNGVIETSRLLGASVYYMTNRQFSRAFANMNSVVEHMKKDLLPERVWQTFRRADVQKKAEEIGLDVEMKYVEFLLDGDYRRKLFLRHAVLFQSMYVGPTLDGGFSYLELRPRVRPKPEDDVVYVNRRVKFFDVWGRYDYDYLTNSIRFVTVKNTLNAAGFPVQIEKPLFSFTDKNIMKKRTNAVPYVYWSQNDIMLTQMLIAESKSVELLAAFYINMEGMRIVKMVPGMGGFGMLGTIHDEGDAERGPAALPDPEAGYNSLSGYNDEEGEDWDDE